MKRGAYDFLTKPFDKQHVVDVVSKALDQARRRRLEYRTDGRTDPVELIGDAPIMLELKRIIEKVAPTPATVLVLGETGTGKELVAEALHRLSPRSSEPLIKINCGAIPENLVESELFGHERGAFTGAERAKPGRFELADGGTLFLDEIGELSPETQVKLLRVIEDRVIERVGGTQPRPIDVRLVTATHRDLAREVQRGAFREDLYYRLKVIVIEVPPLRDRPEDVARLIECFLDRHSGRLQRPRPGVSSEALAALAAQPWPGNVRELENAVERALLLADTSTLTPDDFGLSPADETADHDPTSLKEVSKRAAAETERRMIRAALETYSGNVTRAALRLGLSRRGLQLKMKELGLRQHRD
jgi:DNA-binding NtrC family response regulator